MEKHILITGGAGFIGINSADYFLQKKYKVTLFDNLSRKGSEHNLKWLKKKWGTKVAFVRGDVVTDRDTLARLVKNVDAVLHLAAQVAVTASVLNPHHDFLTNTHGTINVLEAVRRSPKPPLVIYSSTNKVYGNIEHAEIALTDAGYRYTAFQAGIPEACNLDFHSPYGCSKGAADQYVRDYARIYGIPTVVFRQSCIYGPHQFGVEDQGWVAWFVISAMLGRPLTIYGDGYQVRDVLHVDDLTRLYEMAVRKQKNISGKVYNIGGGADQAFSVLSTIAELERIGGHSIVRAFGNWRPGDQKVYVSDISRIGADLGWKPRISFDKGLHTLIKWAESEKKLLKSLSR